MATLKQKQLENGIRAVHETPVSKHVPYTRHFSPTTLCTREGYLLQIIELEGISFETADQSGLDMLKEHRSSLWRGIADPRIVLYTHIIRQEAKGYPAGEFGNSWAKDLDNAYKHKLEQKRLFRNRQFLTVIRRPAKGKVHLLPGLMRMVQGKVDKEAQLHQRKEEMEALDNTVSNITQMLKPYGAKVLRIEEGDNGQLFSPALSFLHYLINLEDRPVAVPQMEISQYLPASRISFGKDAFEVRGVNTARGGAVLSLKEYPSMTGAGLLDTLLRLPYEFIITQSFAFIGRQATLSAMNLQQRKIAGSGEGAGSLVVEMADAIDSVSSGNSNFGYHHFTITIHAEKADALKIAVNDLHSECVNAGIIPVREDINMEAAFWAQLPGNFSYIARRSMVSNRNFAGFSSFHTFPTGKAKGNHWGQAVSLLETTSGSPYYFNFHERDVGNFTLIGPTGTGKTVLLTFLLAQAARLNPRSVYFDKDRGAEIFIRVMGGAYTVVEAGRPTGFNPFHLPDTEKNRAFLREFLTVLAMSHNKTPLTRSEEEIIVLAVRQNFEAPKEYRQLVHLSTLFGGYKTDKETSLETRLAKWYGNGEYAWLFDNEADTLSLENATIGFDLTSILDDVNARTPWLMYVFHRVAERLDGTRTIIMLDEGWKLLDDQVFAAQIKDWEKTIRKQNGLLGFATQSPYDALSNHVGRAIIEQSPTQIFLPNGKARKEEYCDGFGLTYKEWQLVRNTAPESRSFLLKHGNHSVIAKLDLTGMDDFIAVLSGRTETVHLLDKIRFEVGNDISDWLPIFHKRRQEL